MTSHRRVCLRPAILNSLVSMAKPTKPKPTAQPAPLSQLAQWMIDAFGKTRLPMMREEYRAGFLTIRLPTSGRPEQMRLTKFFHRPTMPITPENKHRYPKDWKQISEHIRFVRAGNKCEVCGLENGKVGWRVSDGTFYTAEEFAEDYINPTHEDELSRIVGRNQKEIVIVLTVAHLDHTPENCDESNLKAMCQRCHNRYDAPHRKVNARKTRLKKNPQLNLFA